MKQRIITSVIIVAVALPILIFSEYMIFQIALGVLSLVAMYEIFGVLSLRQNLALALPAYIIAAIVPICAYFVNDNWRNNYIMLICAVIFFYMIWSFAVSVFARGKLKFADVAEAFMLLLYPGCVILPASTRSFSLRRAVWLLSPLKSCSSLVVI